MSIACFSSSKIRACPGVNSFFFFWLRDLVCVVIFAFSSVQLMVGIRPFGRSTKALAPYFIKSDFQRAINEGLFSPYCNAICRYDNSLVKYDSITASLNYEVYLVLFRFRHKPSLPNSLNT